MRNVVINFMTSPYLIAGKDLIQWPGTSVQSVQVPSGLKTVQVQ